MSTVSGGRRGIVVFVAIVASALIATTWMGEFKNKHCPLHYAWLPIEEMEIDGTPMVIYSVCIVQRRIIVHRMILQSAFAVVCHVGAVKEPKQMDED